MLKLGVQLYRTPVLSKACHPQSQRTVRLVQRTTYIYITRENQNSLTRNAVSEFHVQEKAQSHEGPFVGGTIVPVCRYSPDVCG